MSGAIFFLSSSSSTRFISFPNLFSSHLLSQLLTSSSYLLSLLSSSLPLLSPSSFSLPSPQAWQAGSRALSWTRCLCKESWDRGEGAPLCLAHFLSSPSLPSRGGP